MSKLRILLIVFIFLLASIASANEVIDGELCIINADTVIEEDVFVFCTQLIVDGHIKGHLMGAARNAVIRGTVDDSIYLIGGELRVSGQIGKDVHFAGLIIDIQEGASFVHETGGIISANLSNTIEQGAAIPGSIINLGYQLIINGDVRQSISFWGSALQIAGIVNGDIEATVGNSESSGASSQIGTLLIPFPFEVELVDPGLVVRSGAEIAGILEYRGPTPGSIRGQVAESRYIQTGPPLIGNTVEQSAQSVRLYFETVLQEFTTLGFIGAVFLLVMPSQMQTASRNIRFRPLSTLGVGLLSFILSFPIFLIVAVMSVLLVLILSLLPLDTVVIFGGVALALANIGSASIFYFVAIYIARIIVALALGRLILRLTMGRYVGGWRQMYLSLATGVLALALANSIPTVGFAVNALALFLGLGAILSVVRNVFRRVLDSNSHRPSAAYPIVKQPMMLPHPQHTPRDKPLERFASPVMEDVPPTPGTENLPEGFDWWGED